MKKLNLYAAVGAAALLGFTACSNDPFEIPDSRTVIADSGAGIINNIHGPESIELGQLYTFSATSNALSDKFTFTVEDTYFHDPNSYAVNVSTTGKAIHVVFNDYGHYKITATNNRTLQTCSYEVAKYYRGIHQLKYCSDAPALEDGIRISRTISQYFERYVNYNVATCDFSGRITGFEERIVVNVEQKSYEYWYPIDGAPYIMQGANRGTITGTAAKGADVITLPEGKMYRHPKYNSWQMEYNAWFVPYCPDRLYTIPEERCGVL